jgi:hypothetical protein
MEQSDNISDLAAALAKAQGAMSNVVANQKASIQTRTGGAYTYTYADLGAILQAIRKPLSDNGLSVVQGIGTEPGAIIITTQLSHLSGQWVRSQFGLAVSPDATPQEIGSAITYGRKYGLSALIGMASEDDDGKSASEEKPPARQTGRPQPPKPQTTPSSSVAPKAAEVQESAPAVDPSFERYSRMKEAGLKRWPETLGQAIPAAIGRWLTLNKLGNWVDLNPEQQEQAIAKLLEETELQG